MRPIRFAMIFFTAAALAACERQRAPSEYRIPDDYRGWVVIVYGQPGFPALPETNGFIVHPVPLDGILITSTEQQFGWASDRFFMIADDGAATPIIVRAHTTGVNESATSRMLMRYSCFFVGSEKELASATPVDGLLERVQRMVESGVPDERP